MIPLSLKDNAQEPNAAMQANSSSKAMGTLRFRCNVCGTVNSSLVSELGRETPSCSSCKSTVRMRAMIHALSLALFGKSIALPDFPIDKGIHGMGMSDWNGYAVPLGAKLAYTNTFYHKEPRLDILSVAPRDVRTLDFLLSSDVFEHVAPPVSRAFDNARSLIKPGGVLILSVPYALEGPTIEHFPNLNEYSIESRSGERVLVNRTKEGSREEFRNLVFHGGEGDTLEMRLFSKPDLTANLVRAGFQSVQIVSDPCFEHGIVFNHPWSLPVIAR
jgi:hypothetical protein